MSVNHLPSRLGPSTRSWLFTPATRPDRFANAAKSGADVLIVDLEDTVPPAGKSVARDNARTLLAAPPPAGTPLLAVRINSPATRFGIDDLAMLLDAPTAAAFVVLPKTEARVQVEQIAALLDGAGKASAVIPMVETAQGFFAVESIVPPRARVFGLMFGAGDYASDIGAEADSLALGLARCRMVAAAASAGVLAIDAPCFTLHEGTILQTELAFARANGFHAKAAIHPSHISAINAAFTPSPERVAWARHVLEASARGAGVVDGRTVGGAMAREARRVLALASSSEPPALPRRTP